MLLDIINIGDGMFSLLDYLLILPFFALPFIIRIESGRDKKLLFSLLLFNTSLLFFRRISTLPFAALINIGVCSVFVLLSKIKRRKKELYVVVSVDMKENSLTLSDTKQEITLRSIDASLFSVGEIIRIDDVC